MKLFGKICLYLRILKPHRIVNTVSILKKEGLSGIRYHFYLVKDKERGREEKCVREYDISPVEEKALIEEYDIIEFKQSSKPLVSIVIPVYNQFPYTYNCLKSIEKYSRDLEYEIIVGDDNSSDLTTELGEVVKNITIIKNNKNFQFLVNCNRISKEANGKYIVFLNNDTQVQKNWLGVLVDLMEKDDGIGLAGSKLIYPNGLVQEAGGIVWKDATVLQYGNMRQPGEKELNYLRETDYISGACIIIRNELWRQTGGFDERFAPAYYEDVDLAFRIREKGYRVVYQPESEVVHFEGITEGLEEHKNRKIEDNREKFLAKWDKVLAEKHFAAKDYSKLILKMREAQEEHGN